MENKVKLYCAIAFQFLLLAILTGCLFFKIGDVQTLQGALIGLLVGIGINSVKE